MNKLFPINKIKTALLASTLSLISFQATATIVQFETPLGNFEVNLYDQETPIAVNNFLEYVNANDFSNTFIHRSVPNFIIQGGGFTYANAWPPESITTRASIQNEPKYSNVRATIAMAKLPSSPDSATSQWFINLADNSANLDIQNDGFTVFGEVTGDGMAVVDAIAALPRFNFGGALNNLPLQNYDASGSTPPNETHLALVTSITVIDANANTAANLSPALSTKPEPEPEPVVESSGGGSLGFTLIGLMLLLRRQLKR
ncbi:peptidylprolyl isomerase [Aliikangiella sp. IMCC44653]